MTLRAEPHAAVACSAPGVREVSGQPAYRGRVDSGAPGHAIGRQVTHERGKGIEMLQARSERSRSDPSLRHDHVQHGRQQQGVAARPDGEMLVGDRGGLGAARVDDNHAPAAPSNPVQAAAHVGSAHQAPVGHDGIRADDEEEVGAVDIRHRDQPEVSEHAQCGQHLRQLIGGARRVDVARP